MHASGPSSALSPRSPTPAIVLACALLGALTAGGWRFVQQAPMTPGTTIEVPSDVPGPLVRTPDSRTAPAVNARGEGPGWETLNTPQKLALYPLADRWALLSGLQKRRWLALAQGFAALPSDEQARLHDRMTEWASLSAQQRNQARLNFAVTHRMAPEDKRTQWNAYQALSEEDKRKLAARAAQKPQGAAPALRPVSPKKLAKVPAAINAPGNPANPPKVAPAPGTTARIAAPGGLPPESRPAATAENTGVAPAALLPAASAPAPSASASTPAPSDAPAEAQPANLYLN
ncbi:MAG: hypothetical protein C0492_08165 [Verminephrobacter sp.]|nr:hypothetical protein [Verminephrobacter sp.]